MRAFSLLPVERTSLRQGSGRHDAGGLPIRSRLHLLSILILALGAARPASAQFPAELTGRVVDAVTGRPIEAARVEVTGSGHAAVTSGDGEFRIRGLDPGPATLRVVRLGYLEWRREVELRNGERARIRIALAPRPVELEGLRAEIARAGGADAIAITREELRRSGARTAAEALEGRAGIVIRREGPTGPQTAIVRGGSADELLVLIDGAPANGPITGAVDLSSIPAAQIESITVLRGGRSARYGPGAQAGVVLIETRSAAGPAALRVGAGSLGEWTIDGSAGARLLGLDWTLGGHRRAIDGGFEFTTPVAPDVVRMRRNADLREIGGFLAADGRLAGGELRIRAGHTDLERGLPGRGFLPSEHAREALARWRAQAGWEAHSDGGALAIDAYGLIQTAEYRDPDPPIGPPYADRTEAATAGVRWTGELHPMAATGWLRSASIGAELRDQRYQSTAFAPDAPDGRTDLGLFASTELAPGDHPAIPRWVVGLRLDRDGLDRRWRATHELTARSRLGPLGLHVRHASSYSPPTFGDQFFREGVAVSPNPELRAERVPDEIAAGAALSGLAGRVAWRAEVEGYRADVRDMILWSPDFRFVWSPRNFDVSRRGADASLVLTAPARGLELRVSYSLARVTYDRRGGEDVQVIYRPRYSGALGLSWSDGPSRLSIEARYIGRRYPVPAPLNALDPFWEVALRTRRTLHIAGWAITPALTIDRLTDNRDAFIYGYPEPGRTVRVDVELWPN